MKVFYTRKKTTGEEFCRRILSERFGISSPNIVRTKNGKPYLTNAPFYFNVSHSGEVTAVAVSDTEAGLDIEERRERNISAILRKLTEREREEDFFRLWTAKESYVKFRGGTLAQMLPALAYYGGALYENGIPVRAVLTCFEVKNYIFTLCTAYAVEVVWEEV